MLYFLYKCVSYLSTKLQQEKSILFIKFSKIVAGHINKNLAPEKASDAIHSITYTKCSGMCL